ncbi:response regulator transcription factor [Evansella clarkii]|uniref:response regulator transcription factor n=1 Tax=Evansella clarkii TaxID=79879 RepID=UPI000B44D7D7|nr:response regulator transcription factor [Evansella clarkii]
MKVLIGIEHELLRYGLIQLLKDIQPVEYMVEASDTEQFIDSLRKYEFDLTVANTTLPGAGGLPVLISELKNLSPGTKRVLMLGNPGGAPESYSEDSGLEGAFYHGATLDELMEFFQRILKGETAFLHAGKSRHQPGNDNQESHLLSDREKEIFHMKVRGFSVKDTASILKISPKTVENHRRNIRRKLSIGRNSEWYEWGKKLGLL